MMLQAVEGPHDRNFGSELTRGHSQCRHLWVVVLSRLHFAVIDRYPYQHQAGEFHW